MTCHEGQQNHVYRHCDNEFIEKGHSNSLKLTNKMIRWGKYNLHGHLGKKFAPKVVKLQLEGDVITESDNQHEPNMRSCFIENA